MRCLVSGAAGFIGGALAARLAAEGHEVHGLIHQKKPLTPLRNITYHSGDITDYDVLFSLTKGIDVIFHCAAYVKDYGPKKTFYAVNIEGTRALADACEQNQVKRFIFLSHINYQSRKKAGYYCDTKTKAEQHLLQRHAKNGFPVVIIRPGNVYGPGATTWVLRPMQSIVKNRIALIDQGSGIFLHTYIDNLLDALLAAAEKPSILGEVIDVTDGVNTTTWGMYLNSLAAMVDRSPLRRNLSKPTALLIAHLMMATYTVFRIEPWVTPLAVEVFTNKTTVSIQKAQRLLTYEPNIDIQNGLQKVQQWLQTEGYITEYSLSKHQRK